jgi:hypothetical protein
MILPGVLLIGGIVAGACIWYIVVVCAAIAKAQEAHDDRH